MWYTGLKPCAALAPGLATTLSSLHPTLYTGKINLTSNLAEVAAT